MKIQFTKISRNQKTGPMPVSMTERASCPSACPLKNNGCYAEHGPLSMIWRSIEDDGFIKDKRRSNPIEWDRFCVEVSKLPKGQLWRHNAAGDLPGEDNEIDVKKLGLLVKANDGRKGFTYTHKPVNKGEFRKNAEAVSAANNFGFTVNVSADSLVEADELYDLNIGPVVVTLPSDAPQVSKTPKGRHVIACPAEDDKVDCMRCGLCQKASRKAIVGFRAHGVRKSAVNKRLNVIQ
jgi:hypothetical protein